MAAFFVVPTLEDAHDEDVNLGKLNEKVAENLNLKRNGHGNVCLKKNVSYIKDQTISVQKNGMKMRIFKNTDKMSF